MFYPKTIAIDAIVADAIAADAIAADAIAADAIAADVSRMAAVGGGGRRRSSAAFGCVSASSLGRRAGSGAASCVAAHCHQSLFIGPSINLALGLQALKHWFNWFSTELIH